ncbi:MAG: alanine--glyoxylate aminotransferase family protein [Candidatus Omnitrophota bacterium]
MKTNLLLTPGPTKVPEEVYASFAKPIIHHRTPQFQAHLKEAFEGLKYIFQTQNDVFILASSGTGAMEAAVCNLLSPGDKAITVEGGKFGERWTELCKAYKIEPKVIQVPWGKAVEPAQIENALKNDKDIKAVFVTQCETSTGVKTDIQAIANIVKKTNAVCVVDAISGLSVDDLPMDQWSVDVVVSGSQKGFMLPPGLAFISLSAKAWKLVEQSKSPKYYLDLKKAKKAADKTDTAYTSAITLIIALNESIKLIKQRGLQEHFAYFTRLAQAARAAMKALGLSLYTDESCLSNAVTAVKVPEGMDGGKLVKTMRDTYGVTMAGGQGDMKGRIFRIATMGCVNEEDLIAGISCLETVLKEMGYAFKQGAGVAAAQKILNSQKIGV